MCSIHVRNNNEDLYSSTVLVGNWFEDRFIFQTDYKAITPGIYGKSSCINDVSVYNSDFQMLKNEPLPKLVADYHEFSQKSYQNRAKSHESNIKLSDGKQFTKNMTTMKDVMFRIKPGEYTEQVAEEILKKKPKEDISKSYGNATKTGLRQWMACEIWKDKHMPKDRSIYQETYKPKRLIGPVVRFPRPPKAKF